MSKHNTKNTKDTMLAVADTDVIGEVAEVKSALELVREGGSLNFHNITGYALIRCEKEAKKEDHSITVPSLSMTYQAHVAAMACGCKIDDIYALPAADFTRVCLEVQNFLLASSK